MDPLLGPLPALPDITPHIDGFALRFGGEVVAIYPTPSGASFGRQLAKEANAMLAACLANHQH